MTLSEFIAKKPKLLRLGQWFVNCYIAHDPDLFYETDDSKALEKINEYITNFQWNELPEVT